MTLVDIINDTLARIGPGNIATTDQLAVWVNEAYLYICDQIVQENPDYFTVSATADIVQSRFEYALPLDFERVVMVNVNYDGVWRRADVLQEVNQVNTLADVSTFPVFTVNKPAYYINGLKLGILPLPTANVTGGIKMWYVRNIVDLISTDSPLFPSKYHHIVSLGAYANYMDLDDQHNVAESLRNRFEQRVQEMVETLGERQVDTPKMIEVVQDQSLYADNLYLDGQA